VLQRKMQDRLDRAAAGRIGRTYEMKDPHQDAANTPR
jgi:hypothetical protein